jgi:predicted RNase H-like HicB family nuclease
MVKELIFRADFFREDGVYVGICPELNVSSFGEDMDDARRSLREAVVAFIEECDEMGTLEEILEEAGFTGKEDVWFSREPVAEERLAVSR